MRRSNFKPLGVAVVAIESLSSATRSIASAIAATASFGDEVSQLSVRDFDPASKTLRIFGKGRGTQAETIDLGSATVRLWESD